PNRQRMYDRVEGVCHDLETVYQAGAGPAEVGVAVGEVDAAGLDRRQVAIAGLALEDGEVLQRALHREAAAGDEEDIGPGVDQGLPGRGAGRLAGTAEDVDSARYLDQRGVPVAAIEEG